MRLSALWTIMRYALDRSTQRNGTEMCAALQPQVVAWQYINERRLLRRIHANDAVNYHNVEPQKHFCAQVCRGRHFKVCLQQREKIG